MFCIKCGKELSEDVAVCPQCGAQINETTETTTQGNYEPISEQKPKKNKKLIFIIILAAVATVLTIVVGALILDSIPSDIFSETNTETNSETDAEIDVDIAGSWEYVGTMDSETGEDIPSPESYVESCTLDSDYTGTLTIVLSGQSFDYDITWQKSESQSEVDTIFYEAYTDDGTEIGISYVQSSEALMFLVDEDWALLQRSEEAVNEEPVYSDSASILGNWKYQTAVDSDTGEITSTPGSYITDMTFLEDNSAMIILVSTDTYDTAVIDDARWRYIKTDSKGILVYELSLSNTILNLYLDADGENLVMIGSAISLGYIRK